MRLRRCPGWVSGGGGLVTAPTPGAVNRAPIGATPTVRRRLALQRPRPLLVRAYAALFSDGGTFGGFARRRAGRLALRSLTPAVTVGTGALVVLGAFDASAPGWPCRRSPPRRRRALAVTARRRAAARSRGGGGLARAARARGALPRRGPSIGRARPPVRWTRRCSRSSTSSWRSSSRSWRGGWGSRSSRSRSRSSVVWHGRGARVGELPAAIVRAAFVMLFAVLYRAALAVQLAAAKRAGVRGGGAPQGGRRSRARVSPHGLRGRDVGAGRRRALADRVRRGGGERDARRARGRRGRAPEPHLRGVPAGRGGRAARARECRSPATRSRAALGARGARRRHRASYVGAPARRDQGRDLLRGRGRPGALLVVPLVDRRGGHVRGVIVADRREPAPFSDEDEKLVQTLCAEIFRALEAERVMGDIKTTRDEKTRFYDAIEALNRTKTPDEVFRAPRKVSREGAGRRRGDDLRRG